MITVLLLISALQLFQRSWCELSGREEQGWGGVEEEEEGKRDLLRDEIE